MLDPSTMMKQSLGVKGGDVAFPCGYQNKTDQSDAINLVNSGCRILVQGFHDVVYTPQIHELRTRLVTLEILQTTKGQDDAMHEIILSLHHQRSIIFLTCLLNLCSSQALVHGAVFSAFLTIAQAMSDQGCV
ncbi:hypothetical protein D5086_001758 [Populus alba]|uniref:Uncharacterized protein n=1 Tax=Populus alba TaxID=43335 RepID=A0ACC4D024_POPAL